jgi:hypothetical protein
MISASSEGRRPGTMSLHRRPVSACRTTCITRMGTLIEGEADER